MMRRAIREKKRLGVSVSLAYETGVSFSSLFCMALAGS